LNFSLKEVSFSDKDENNDNDDNDKRPLHSAHAKISPQSPTTSQQQQQQQRLRKDPLLKQTVSELDIGENFEINKTNPIFQSEIKSKVKYEKAISEPSEPTTTLASIKSNLNNNTNNINNKSTLSSMSRLLLPRMSKEHIYEDLYQSVDPRTKTNNTYDTFYNKLDNHGTTKSNSDFRLTINIENQTSNSGPPLPPPPPPSQPIMSSSSSNTNENDPIYIDPADFAKDQEPSSFDKDITIVNLSNGTIGKSLGKTILSDSNINDMYKSALTEKLKLNNNNNNNNTKKSLASGTNQAKGNSESSGVSTMFGSFLKNDDSSTSDEFSFQSQLYKESIRSESGFVGFNYRKATTDFLAEVK